MTDEMEQSVSIEPHHSILEAILETSAEAIVATDRDGNVIFWNPGATRVFGFTDAEALGSSLDLIIPERLRPRHWEGFRKTVATGRSRYSDGDLLSVPAITKRGDRISVEFTITMLRDGVGAVVGMIAIMREVTKRFEDQKRLERKLVELQAGRIAN
jgi:PAS domain S-box-containing protein